MAVLPRLLRAGVRFDTPTVIAFDNHLTARTDFLEEEWLPNP